MKKTLAEQVWPVENYTDKIHTGVKATMQTYSHLSFTLRQLRPYLERGYTWLKNPDERQSDLLDKIITTGIRKLIQAGKVKRVSSKVSVEAQWQWATTVAESGYTNITSDDEVAQNGDAQKATSRRAVGARTLWRLNNKVKLGVLHA